MPSLARRANAARIQSSGCSGDVFRAGEAEAIAFPVRGGTIPDGDAGVKFLAKTSGNLRIRNFESSARNFRSVADPGEPVDVWFAAKPSELAFGVAAGGLAGFFLCFSFWEFFGGGGGPF